ncbi:hypothetical protein HDU96_006607 [Phlyctochytrium bullatum]|nr:hypothetical protein HDU96_006607 [Phlyctochytrium bullatum]
MITSTTTTLLAAAAAIALMPTPIPALSLYEPPDGLAMLSAWVDISSPAPGTSGGDTPTLYNTRLGRNAPAFHLSQNIPLDIAPWDNSELTANLSMVQDTGTDALFFLTVYPNKGFDGYTREDVDKLVRQVDAISNPVTGSSRRVMLRFAPEMNGNWFTTYCQRPTRFVQAYRELVLAVRNVTSRVAFVWSPNASNNYPFGPPVAGAEISALDTDGDGTITFNDDPYGPYWPGEEYVDWVGISLYWKGYFADGFPQILNKAAPGDFFVQMIQGGGTEGGNPKYPLYSDYSVKYNKPLVMSEGAAAFALSDNFNGNEALLPSGVGRTAVQQSFWRTFLTNTTFLDAYPKAKLFDFFEQIKVHEDGSVYGTGVTRDYRITTDPDTLAAFQADLAGVASRYAWAGRFVPGLDPLLIEPGTNGSTYPTVTTRLTTTTTVGSLTTTMTTTTAGRVTSSSVTVVTSMPVTTETTRASGAAGSAAVEVGVVAAMAAVVALALC